MTTELDPRLELCYKLAEKDRDKCSTQSRESLNKIFLRLIGIFKKSRNLTIEDLKAEFKYIVKSTEGVERNESMRKY